jgi:hypothetical protein
LATASPIDSDGEVLGSFATVPDVSSAQLHTVLSIKTDTAMKLIHFRTSCFMPLSFVELRGLAETTKRDIEKLPF